MESFVKEADEVKHLTEMKGWSILTRDLNQYRQELIRKLAYINPKRPEFNELRILFLSTDKIITMVEDYLENRDTAIELMRRLENADLEIPLDVDNEIEPKVGSSMDSY